MQVVGVYISRARLSFLISLLRFFPFFLSFSLSLISSLRTYATDRSSYISQRDRETQGSRERYLPLIVRVNNKLAERKHTHTDRSVLLVKIVTIIIHKIKKTLVFY